MADSISIVMKLNDDVTGPMKSIASTSQGVSKEFEELERKTKHLGQRYADFNKKSSQTYAEALSIKKAMGEAAKAFKKTGDEADKVRFEQLREEYQALTDSAKGYASEAKNTQKAMQEQYDAMRKLGSSGGGDSSVGDSSGGFLTSVFGEGLGGGLAASGVLKEIGSSLTEAASGLLESSVGQPLATMLDSTLSSAFSGAAAGAIAGPIGAAVGAVGGGIAGAISGGTQIFQQKDKAFKSYVQEAAEEQLQAQSDDISRGSTIAAERQQDAIAFNQLLGAGIGDQYLKDLRTMAAKTPMEYSDLTNMSRALATGFGDDPGRMLKLMRSVGNAGSAVGIDASGMTEMSKAFSLMQSSGKATLEKLNIFQERGVDVIGMLSNGLDKTQAQIYDMISKGQIGGVEAVNIIQAAMDQMYDGAMEKQSKTFSGLSSTLADAETEMQAAYGEGFNEGRKAGLQAQRDWLSGESGAAVMEANKAIGAWKAELENSKEQYIRDAVDAMMGTDEYQTAKEADDAAEMGRLIMQAKTQGMNEYNASEGAQLALESEKALAEAIRNDASTNQDYWDAGYEKGNWFTKGLAASIGNRSWDYESKGASSPSRLLADYNSHAYGLNYVPYDGYPALLHEGERVMTAAENRNSAAQTITVQVTGNAFSVRSDEDIDAIARQIAVRVREAQDTYGG